MARRTSCHGTRKNASRSAQAEARPWAVPLALLLIIAASMTLFFSFYYGVSPIAGADNYLYSNYASSFLNGGFNSMAIGGPMSTKYVIILGEAFFMSILGQNGLSVAMFDAACLAATIMAIYVIGRELYSRRAGMLAAAIYGFVPMVVTQASNSGDDVPMALFAVLSVMLLVLALKSRRRHELLFALSGFVALIGAFTVGEELLVLVFIAIVALWHFATKVGRERLYDLVCLAGGIALGVLVMMLIGWLQTGSPLYLYNTNYQWYSTTYCGASGPIGPCAFTNTSNMNQYLSAMFPYDVAGRLQAALNSGPGFNLTRLSVSVITPSAYSDTDYQFGHLFYLVVLSGIFLAVVREKRAAFPALWLVVMLLLLGFGSMSLTHYIRISPVWPRFLLIAVPAASLLLGLGLAKALDMGDRSKGRSHRIKRMTAYLIVAAVMICLLTEFALFTRYLNYSWYSNVYPIVQVGKFVSGLGPDATVMVQVGVYLSQYSGFRKSTAFAYSGQGSCGQVPNGAYVVMLANSTIQGACNFTEVYAPQDRPQWLSNYTIYENALMNFSRLRVYTR